VTSTSNSQQQSYQACQGVLCFFHHLIHFLSLIVPAKDKTPINTVTPQTNPMKTKFNLVLLSLQVQAQRTMCFFGETVLLEAKPIKTKFNLVLLSLQAQSYVFLGETGS
jgi:hypothetical protein